MKSERVVISMTINTRLFGEVTVDEEKKITFPGGIIGFPDLQNFVLVHDEEKADGGIRWLQSVEEPTFAMPVIDPLMVCADYNPQVDDSFIKKIGEIKEDGLLVLTTITVPSDVKNMTVNLKAPFIINVEANKACQVIVEEYDVKFPVYEILKSRKESE